MTSPDKLILELVVLLLCDGDALWGQNRQACWPHTLGRIRSWNFFLLLSHLLSLPARWMWPDWNFQSAVWVCRREVNKWALISSATHYGCPYLSLSSVPLQLRQTPGKLSLVMDLSFEACWSLASDFYTLRIIIELNPLYWFMCRDIVK